MWKHRQHLSERIKSCRGNDDNQMLQRSITVHFSSEFRAEPTAPPMGRHLESETAAQG